MKLPSKTFSFNDLVARLGTVVATTQKPGGPFSTWTNTAFDLNGDGRADAVLKELSSNTPDTKHARYLDILADDGSVAVGLIDGVDIFAIDGRVSQLLQFQGTARSEAARILFSTPDLRGQLVTHMTGAPINRTDFDNDGLWDLVVEVP
jgi:hypothetical protein